MFARLVWLLMLLGVAVSVGAIEPPTIERADVKQVDLEPRDSTRSRAVPVRIYHSKQTGKQPVILFSHGLGGSRENSPYLGEYWASHGYVCVFMQHAGSDEDVWKAASLRERMSTLAKAASPKNLRDRIQDVSFVIDQLDKWNRESGHPLFERLDLEHLGMCGHSFGAVTTLAVAGQQYPLGKSFREPRIDAFLAMSPQTSEALAPEASFGQLASPILCMTGTRDDSPISERSSPSSRREVYRALPAGDKYELVFDGGTHFAFSDVVSFRTRGRDPDHHPSIQRIGLEFWNAYLKDQAPAKEWLKSENPKGDCPLKATDIWQWK